MLNNLFYSTTSSRIRLAGIVFYEYFDNKIDLNYRNTLNPTPCYRCIAHMVAIPNFVSFE